MGIDASIAAGVQPVQFQGPMDQMGKYLMLKHLMLQGNLQDVQIQEAQRKLMQEQQLADVYRQNVNPDGTVNHAGVIQAMGDNGLGQMIPAYRRTMLDADKDQAEIDSKKATTDQTHYDTTLKRTTAVNSALDSLRSNPNVTHDDVISTVVGLVRDGIMPMQQGQAIMQELPSHPAALQGYLTQKGLQVADAKTRLEMLAPKFQTLDNGGSVVMGAVNPLTGKFTQNGAMQKVATPGEVLASRTQQRGQDMEQAVRRVDIQPTPTGLTSVDKLTGQATPITDAGSNVPTQQVNSPLVQQAKQYQQIKEATAQAKTLLPQATASGAGALTDQVLGYGGIALPGADAASQLATIGGWMTSNVPRMEGPQSDADTKMYKQMAGQVGDATLPASVRMKALEALETLQDKYAGNNGVKSYLATKDAAAKKNRPPLDAIFAGGK